MANCQIVHLNMVCDNYVKDLQEVMFQSFRATTMSIAEIVISRGMMFCGGMWCFKPQTLSARHFFIIEVESIYETATNWN